VNSAGTAFGNSIYDAFVSNNPSKIESAVLGEGLKAGTDKSKAALQKSVGQGVETALKPVVGQTAAAVGGAAASAVTGVAVDKLIDAGAEAIVAGPERPSAPKPTTSSTSTSTTQAAPSQSAASQGIPFYLDANPPPASISANPPPASTANQFFSLPGIGQH